MIEDRDRIDLSTALRTRVAGELRADDAGTGVSLCGWIHRRRDHGGLVFVDLRDRWGTVQCVANPETLDEPTFEVVSSLRAEDVVRIEGEVRLRPEGNRNPEIATGDVEVEITGCERLSRTKTPPFPIDVEKESGEVTEDLRLRYRFLELRRPRLVDALDVRHRTAFETRRYFHRRGFWELETPILTRRTPEGARDYLVPSRVHPGQFYALPQSPQLYKQVLMVAGYDRYVQIARCFRDEDLRADRQPEFTQIDVEMSFVEQDDVVREIDGLFVHLFDRVLGVEIDEIPRLAHHEAMARYGTDKPDLRFGNELVDVTEAFRETGFRIFDSVVEGGGRIVALRVPEGADASRSVLDRWTETAQDAGAKGLVWAKRTADGWASSIDKFVDAERWERAGGTAGAAEGDLLLVVADRPRTARSAMGVLRLELARERGWIEQGRAWAPVWIVDFPLFEIGDEGELEPSHHPFTAPVGGLDAITEDPAAASSKAYDFVLNGYELGSGSIRIHRREVQEKMLELLGIGSEEADRRFGFLLEALEHGAPPHGGIAIGLDRTAMLLAGRRNLREVIPFPKTTTAQALFEGAPSPVESELLEELGIRVVEPEGD